MDLQHPDITKTLLTGYPTNEDVARDNEPLSKDSYDYNSTTAEDDE